MARGAGLRYVTSIQAYLFRSFWKRRKRWKRYEVGRFEKRPKRYERYEVGRFENTRKRYERYEVWKDMNDMKDMNDLTFRASHHEQTSAWFFQNHACFIVLAPLFLQVCKRWNLVELFIFFMRVCAVLPVCRSSCFARSQSLVLSSLAFRSGVETYKTAQVCFLFCHHAVRSPPEVAHNEKCLFLSCLYWKRTVLAGLLLFECNLRKNLIWMLVTGSSSCFCNKYCILLD